MVPSTGLANNNGEDARSNGKAKRCLGYQTGDIARASRLHAILDGEAPHRSGPDHQVGVTRPSVGRCKARSVGVEECRTMCVSTPYSVVRHIRASEIAWPHRRPKRGPMGFYAAPITYAPLRLGMYIGIPSTSEVESCRKPSGIACQLQSLPGPGSRHSGSSGLEPHSPAGLAGDARKLKADPRSSLRSKVWQSVPAPHM